jgi:thioredoxin-related protein
MRIFNLEIMNKRIVLLLIIIISISSCKKDDPIYDVNEIQAHSYNANKNKLKSASQYISILYANLFQKALSPNELVHEVIISNFMNKEGITIPSDSLMREDLNLFIEDTYKRFYVRDITEAEREYFLNFFASHPNVSSEMVYTAFSLSNEYQFY